MEPAQAAAAPVQAGDHRHLIREGKLLEVHCASCRGTLNFRLLGDRDAVNLGLAGVGLAAVIFGDLLAAGMLCVTVSHRRSYSNTWPLPDAAAATTGMDHSDAEKLEKLDKKDSRVH